jgi:ribosomal protein S18 acetylase RimI-like enzyme
MYQLSSNTEIAPVLTAPHLHAVEVRTVRLTDEDKTEVLEFLAQRPLHTVAMASLIRDNGVQSSFNRGTFHGCRDEEGHLEGVALIGHATLMETTTDRALQAFADTAQHCTSAHVILCEEDRLEKFWSYYAPAGQEMERACRELLFELRWPIEASEPVANLIPATSADWVLIEDGKLIFKADVIADTPETTYIEGVWVNPELRGQGYGRRCMSQLARMLMWRTKSLCLLVNDENEDARRFYRSVGYHLRTVYDTIFLK